MNQLRDATYMRYLDRRPNSMMDALVNVADVALEILKREARADRIRRAFADIPDVLQEGQPELDPNAPDFEERVMERVQIYFRYMTTYGHIPSYRVFLRKALLPNIQWIHDMTPLEPGYEEEYELVRREEAIAEGLPLEPLVEGPMEEEEEEATVEDEAAMEEEAVIEEPLDEVQNAEEYMDFGNESGIEDYLDTNELVDYETAYEASSENEEEEDL